MSFKYIVPDEVKNITFKMVEVGPHGVSENLYNIDCLLKTIKDTDNACIKATSKMKAWRFWAFIFASGCAMEYLSRMDTEKKLKKLQEEKGGMHLEQVKR